MTKAKLSVLKLPNMVFTALMILLILGGGLLFTYQKVLDTVREQCYEDLNDVARANTEDIRNLFEGRQLHIQSLATILQAVPDLAVKEQVQPLLRAFRTGPVESRLALLYSDDRVLRDDGLSARATAELSFAKVREKGGHISSDVTSLFTKDAQVIHIYAPVYKEGKVVALVYESIQLKALQHYFNIDLYDSRAQIFVVDGETGHFLLDNWHADLNNNITMFYQRKYYPGYSAQQFVEDLKNGIPGNTIYLSKKVNEFLYTRYQPIGINAWQSIISLRESDVLYRVRLITRELWCLILLHGLVFLLFMLWVVYLYRKQMQETERASYLDLNTGLENRNAYMRFLTERPVIREPLVTCVYFDVNGLHELNNTYGHEAGDLMLRTVAEAIREAFPSARRYRLGGDEFLAIIPNLAEDKVQAALATVQAVLAQKNYSISCGSAQAAQGSSLKEAVELADSKMLLAKKAHYNGNNNRRKNKI